jgi:hypothetical protein
MPHASFLVGASRSCAHLIYRASAVIIVIAARFDTAILGKSDLPSLTNNIYALEYLFSDLMKKNSRRSTACCWSVPTQRGEQFGSSQGGRTAPIPAG